MQLFGELIILTFIDLRVEKQEEKRLKINISTQPEDCRVPDILGPKSISMHELVADTILKGAVETRSTAVSV